MAVIAIVGAGMMGSALANEYVMQANLNMVGDRMRKWTDKVEVIRCLSMYYSAVNESSDSIYIPIGYSSDNPLKAYIESHDSLKTTFNYVGCSKRKGTAQYDYAPGDSILISFHLYVESNNSIDSEWLQKLSTKELISKIHIEMAKPTEGENLDKIPTIIFKNDTNDICVNPIIKPRKWNPDLDNQ